MKRLFFLAFGLLMFCSSVEAQDIMNLRMNRDELGLRGDVTALDEDNLYKKDYFRGDWPTRKWFRTDLRQFLQEESGHIYTFTNNGNLEQVTYTRRGSKVAGTKVSYAKNGLLTSFLGEGYKIEGKYNGNRGDFNIYAEERTYSNGIDLATANLATTDYKTSYPFAFVCRQQLSDDGLVLKSNYYYVDSMPAREVQYTYSALGRVAVMRTTSFDKNGMPSAVTTTSYTYDGNGYLTRKNIRNAGGNDNFTYQNNALGDCVEMLAEHPYGTSTYTYEYEYDDYGNWVMRLTFKDGEFEYATLRKITYGKNAKNLSAEEVNALNAPATADADKAKASKKADKKEKSTQKEVKEKSAKAKQEPAASSKASKEIDKEKKQAVKDAAKATEKEQQETSKDAAKAAAKEQKKAAKEAEKAKKKAAKEAEKNYKQEVKDERARIEKEAADTAKQIAKEQKKADKKNARIAKKATKKAQRQSR